MKKSEQIDELYESTFTENNIMCTSCHSSASVMNIDPYEAADHWYHIGWRATLFGNIYCPKCAKKKLKT